MDIGGDLDINVLNVQKITINVNKLISDINVESQFALDYLFIYILCAFSY